MNSFPALLQGGIEGRCAAWNGATSYPSCTYRDTDVHVLRFIRRARDLGFSLPEIKALLALWKNRRRESAGVKKMVQKHVTELDAKIAELQTIRRTLVDLAHHCHGDHRPECPILDDFSGGH